MNLKKRTFRQTFPSLSRICCHGEMGRFPFKFHSTYVRLRGHIDILMAKSENISAKLKTLNNFRNDQ